MKNLNLWRELINLKPPFGGFNYVIELRDIKSPRFGQISLREMTSKKHLKP